MIKLGNHREEVLAKKNKALHGIIAKNKAEVEHKMQMMAKQFYLQIAKIRKRAAKDRKYQERRLSKTTGKLFAVLAKNQHANEALRSAKHGFANRLGALHTTVQKNDKKAMK